jgi:arylsulfatase A-like enzyme
MISDQPNILVFMTDDHGQWASHCYGNYELHTPNMDRLAGAGVRMGRAFTPSPVCSPARASFFTGRFLSQHGIHDWINESPGAAASLNIDDQNTIAQLLQQTGYETALFGKWHCGRSRKPAAGFDRWFSYFDDQLPHCGTQRFSDQGELVVEHGRQSPLITNHVIDFLGARDHGRPFFACVGYVNTHSPFADQPEHIAGRYRDCLFDDVPDELFYSAHGEAFVPVPDDKAMHREQLVQYYAAVTAIDEQVGVIIDHLERTGQLHNTLIVYTSDHGHMCGHHGLWRKGNATTPQNFFDESILVPCILS